MPHTEISDDNTNERSKKTAIVESAESFTLYTYKESSRFHLLTSIDPSYSDQLTVNFQQNKRRTINLFTATVSN